PGPQHQCRPRAHRDSPPCRRTSPWDDSRPRHNGDPGSRRLICLPIMPALSPSSPMDASASPSPTYAARTRQAAGAVPARATNVAASATTTAAAAPAATIDIGGAPKPAAKYPPLIVEALPDWPYHFRELKRLLGHTPNGRPYGKGVRFIPKSDQEFRLIQRYLTQLEGASGISWFCYSLPAERSLKVAIRGLPADTDPALVEQELRELGYMPEHVRAIPARPGRPGCLMYAQLQRTSDLTPGIYEEPPTCANCGEAHTANNAACAVFRKEARNRRAGTIARTATVARATTAATLRGEADAPGSLTAAANQPGQQQGHKRRRKRCGKRAKARKQCAPPTTAPPNMTTVQPPVQPAGPSKPTVVAAPERGTKAKRVAFPQPESQPARGPLDPRTTRIIGTLNQLQTSYALGVEVCVDRKPTRVYAFYKPPANRIAVADVHTLLDSPLPTIIAGDFNAKHTAWNSSSVNPDGRRLLDDADRHGYGVLGPEVPTHYPYGASFMPDVIDLAITRGLAVAPTIDVLDDHLISDHQVVLLTLNTTPTITTPSAPKQRQDFGMKNPADVDRLALDFSATMSTALRQSRLDAATTRRPPQLPAHIKAMIEQKRKLRRKWQNLRCPNMRSRLNSRGPRNSGRRILALCHRAGRRRQHKRAPTMPPTVRKIHSD
ncbi:jg8284, partial [Pararge aegeria aegeria]